MKVTVTCPECDDELTADVLINTGYGADADGNRGVNRNEVTLEEHTKCSLTDYQLEELKEEAIFSAECDEDDDSYTDYDD